MGGKRAPREVCGCVLAAAGSCTWRIIPHGAPATMRMMAAVVAVVVVVVVRSETDAQQGRTSAG